MFWKDYPHVAQSQQFSRDDLLRICHLAAVLKRHFGSRRCERWLNDTVLAFLFYEPSTRTRFSFESAALRLGALKMETENASVFSSAKKGETFEDSVKVMAAYADGLIIRKSDDDFPEHAIAALQDIESATAIINAGAGKLQHPTQALLDIFTIFEHFGSIDGLTVGLVGDLAHGRTARSLAYNLRRFEKIKLIFCAHELLQVGEDLLSYLQERNIEFEVTDDFIRALESVNVLYMTRSQLERQEKELQELNQKIVDTYTLTGDLACTYMKEGAIIMHPLPRTQEITREVDNLPSALYFTQAANGLYVRMALLLMIFNPQKAQELIEG